MKHIGIDLQFQKGYTAWQKNGGIIGFLSYYVNEGVAHIGCMGVRKEFHRNGVGRKLVQALTAELRPAEGDRTTGVEKVRVNTLGDSVEYEPYERTRAFYRGVGFSDLERIEQDDPECPEQLIMELTIPAR